MGKPEHHCLFFLHQVVSEKDAHEVVEIMKEALYDRFMDDIACIDFRRVRVSVPYS